jgi:hypothetical protein
MSKNLTGWQALSRLKLEFGLVLLCALQFMKLLISLMVKGHEVKEVYDVISIGLPKSTEFVLNASDFVVSYWFLLLPLAFIGGLGLGAACLYLLAGATAKNPDDPSVIKMQYTLITACVSIALVLFLAESSITTYLMSPVFKLISAV